MNNEAVGFLVSLAINSDYRKLTLGITIRTWLSLNVVTICFGSVRRKVENSMNAIAGTARMGPEASGAMRCDF
ncbi:MAG: hypothetical protein ACE5G1_06870 [bacterium]